MTKNFMNSINSMHSICKKIIIFGLILSIALLIIPLAQYTKSSDINYNTLMVMISTIKTSLIVFAETIGGALFMDLMFKR